jgi:lipopolysaccharide export system permease protein
LTKRATDDKGASIQIDWLSDFIAKIVSFLPAKKEKVISNKTIEEKEVEIETFVEEKTGRKPVSVPKINSSELAALIKKYTLFSTIALILNITLIIIITFIGKPENTIAYLYTFAPALLLFVCILVSHFTLTKISSITNKRQDINLLILLFAGFPFYIFFYLYNRNFLKSTITTTENNN